MPPGLPSTREQLDDLALNEFAQFFRSRFQGIPTQENVDEMRGVFQRMLSTGELHILLDDDDDDATALARCHSQGWIYSDIVLEDHGRDFTRYCFPSPLHRLYICYLLSSKEPLEGTISP